jgi:universal stress protein E
MKRVLVPYDFSPCAKRALRLAVSGFPSGPAVRIEVLTVIDDSLFGSMKPEPGIAEALHREVTQICGEQEKITIKETIVHGTPWRRIVEEAEASHSDLILLGARAHGGISEAVLGRTAMRVLRHTLASVLLIKNDDAMALPKKMLCAIDIREDAAPLLRAAEGVRVLSGGSLSLLHLIEEGVAPPYLKSELDRHWKQLAIDAKQDLREIAARAGINEANAEVVRGHLREALPRSVRSGGIELLVLGSHQRPALERFVLGSFAEAAVACAPCDTLVIRA